MKGRGGVRDQVMLLGERQGRKRRRERRRKIIQYER